MSTIAAVPTPLRVPGMTAWEKVPMGVENSQQPFPGPRFITWLGPADDARNSAPNPFSWYPGAPVVQLPDPEDPAPATAAHASGHGSVKPAPLTVASLSRFFMHALAPALQSRPVGFQWSLDGQQNIQRFHPTEISAVLPPMEHLHNQPAAYRYLASENALESQGELGFPTWAALTARHPAACFVVGLSSFRWREAWKFGEAAYRCCRHDLHHAVPALQESAAALGWQVTLLPEDEDAQLCTLLDAGRVAPVGLVHPEVLALVSQRVHGTFRDGHLARPWAEPVPTLPRASL